MQFTVGAPPGTGQDNTTYKGSSYKIEANGVLTITTATKKIQVSPAHWAWVEVLRDQAPDEQVTNVW